MKLIQLAMEKQTEVSWLRLFRKLILLNQEVNRQEDVFILDIQQSPGKECNFRKTLLPEKR